MSTYWISGATGAWGYEIIRRLLTDDERGLKIVAYCRGEARADALLRTFHRDERLMIYLGDIRDYDRVRHSMRRVGATDCVIHAAAMKRVDAGLYSPTEMSSVNIDGTKTVIKACFDHGVGRAFYISTDKACKPTTFYGLTKGAAEALWISADDVFGFTKFITVRFGNALGSTGSVLEIWRRCIDEGKPLPMRFDGSATRFVVSLPVGAYLVKKYLYEGKRGVVNAPEFPAVTLYNLAKAFAGDNYPVVFENTVPGEKPHEQLLPDGPTSADGELLTVGEMRDMLQKAGLIGEA